MCLSLPLPVFCYHRGVISVVIPLYNEQESLRPLLDQLFTMARECALELEVIFVDDGSTDGSWDVVCLLAHDDARVRGLRFRRNFGKAAGLTAGFRAAKGATVVMMDADLQDDPAELPHFLQALAAGADLVSGWKENRLDPVGKIWPSRIFNAMVNASTGMALHDHNCGFKAMRLEVARALKLDGDFHRFIPVLAHARGFRVVEIPVRHRPRAFGRSKYGPKRFLWGMVDLLTILFLTGFGRRPQHLLGGIGCFFLLAGSLALGVLGVEWMARLFDPTLFGPISQRPLLFIAIGAVLFGAQMLSLGLLCSFIASFHQSEEPYAVAEQTDDCFHRLSHGAGDDATTQKGIHT